MSFFVEIIENIELAVVFFLQVTQLMKFLPKFVEVTGVFTDNIIGVFESIDGANRDVFNITQWKT